MLLALSIVCDIVGCLVCCVAAANGFSTLTLILGLVQDSILAPPGKLLMPAGGVA